MVLFLRGNKSKCELFGIFIVLFFEFFLVCCVLVEVLSLGLVVFVRCKIDRFVFIRVFFYCWVLFVFWGSVCMLGVVDFEFS